MSSSNRRISIWIHNYFESGFNLGLMKI